MCNAQVRDVSVSPTGSNEGALENVGDAYDHYGIVVFIHDTRLARTVTIGFDEYKLSTVSREKKLRLLALLVTSTLLTTHSGRPTVGGFSNGIRKLESCLAIIEQPKGTAQLHSNAGMGFIQRFSSVQIVVRSCRHKLRMLSLCNRDDYLCP
jgi:hypothetical protein